MTVSAVAKRQTNLHSNAPRNGEMGNESTRHDCELQYKCTLFHFLGYEMRKWGIALRTERIFYLTRRALAVLQTRPRRQRHAASASLIPIVRSVVDRAYLHSKSAHCRDTKREQPNAEHTSATPQEDCGISHGKVELKTSETRRAGGREEAPPPRPTAYEMY